MLPIVTKQSNYNSYTNFSKQKYLQIKIRKTILLTKLTKKELSRHVSVFVGTYEILIEIPPVLINRCVLLFFNDVCKFGCKRKILNSFKTKPTPYRHARFNRYENKTGINL